jgi:hydrogenase small subunit
MISSLRSITNRTVNKEPKWRHRGTRLTTGYEPHTYRERNTA